MSSINIPGVGWKDIDFCDVNVLDNWTSVLEIHGKVAGQWKLLYEKTLPSPIALQPGGIQVYNYQYPSYGFTMGVVNYDDGTGPYDFLWYFSPTGFGSGSIYNPTQAYSNFSVQPYFSRTLSVDVTGNGVNGITRTLSTQVTVSNSQPE